MRNPISSLHAKTACISITGDMEKLSTKQRRSFSNWSWLVSLKRRSSREIGDRLDEWTLGTNSCNRAYVNVCTRRPVMMIHVTAFEMG